MTLGVSTRRIDAPPKLTGAAVFTEDMPLAGLSHARLVLSTEASARITSIDASEAAALPGVIAVVTGRDLPRVDASPSDLPLALDRVLYTGQPVAAVIATSPALAADAASRVVVEYEPLPAAPGLEAALAAGAPRVLDHAEGPLVDASTHGGSAAAEAPAGAGQPANVSSVAHLGRGDAGRALAESALVVSGSYRMPAVHHGFLETHVATARPEPGGGATVWTPTQGIFATRQRVAETLDVPVSRVRVVPMPVGGGFGGKIVLLEPLVALLARSVRRPVRLALTRSDEFLTGRPAPASVIDIELGADPEGRLTALRARITYENGAAAGWHGAFTAMLIASPYRIQDVDVEAREVTTNRIPAEAYRAPGATQAFFALESAVDEVAESLRIDPLELRLRNACTEGDLRPDGVEWPRIGFVECLRAAREMPLLREPLGAGEAVGVAAGFWTGANAPAGAGCRLEPDGTFVVHVGSVDISGTDTTLALIAAGELGLPVDQVRIEHGDTATAPQSPSAGGSAITYSLGGAVRDAAAEARRQVFDIAAEELEAAPEDLEIEGGVVRVKGVPARTVTLEHIGSLAGEYRGRHRPVHGFGRSAVHVVSPMFTVHAARVRVDEETGAVAVTGYAAVQDVGRALNPAEVVGQVRGGVVQGLGRALGEILHYDESGTLRTGSFLDYQMPTSDQVPEIDVKLVEVPSAAGPAGAKGVGEPPNVPGPAAVMNAIARATGRRLRSLPIDPSALIGG